MWWSFGYTDTDTQEEPRQSSRVSNQYLRTPASIPWTGRIPEEASTSFRVRLRQVACPRVPDVSMSENQIRHRLSLAVPLALPFNPLLAHAGPLAILPRSVVGQTAPKAVQQRLRLLFFLLVACWLWLINIKAKPLVDLYNAAVLNNQTSFHYYSKSRNA